MAMLMLTSVVLTSCNVDDADMSTTTEATTTTTTGKNPNPGPEPGPGPDPSDPVYNPDDGLTDEVVDDGVTVSGDLKVLIIGDARAAGSVDYLNEIGLAMGYSSVKVGCVYSYYKATIAYFNMSTTLPSTSERFIYKTLTSTQSDAGEWVYENYETNIMSALDSETWDHIILTETYYEAALASYNTQSQTFLNNNAKFKEVVNAINAKCPNAKVYFQTCYADIASDHEDWYTAVIGNLDRTTNGAAIDGIIPVATAVQNFYENMPIYSDVTSDMARYVASMTVASTIAGKNPATVARNSDVFDYKIGVAVMRESVQNAKNTPNATTDSVIDYNYYAPESSDNKYESGNEFLKAMNVEILNYYQNKSYAISLTFDDGDVASAEICAEILKKYDVSASFYIQTNMSSVTNEKWVRWEKLLEEYGEWVDVGSHDYTGFQNRTDVQSETVDAELEAATIEKMKNLLDSYSILSSISPNESVISYCTPGAGIRYMNRMIQMKFPIFAGDRVGGNLDGTKANTPYASDFDEEDFYCLGSGNVVNQRGESNFAYHTGTSGGIYYAQQNLGWYIPLQHGIIPNGDTTITAHNATENSEGITGWVDITREALEDFCESISTLGGAWLGSYNDVLRYVREAKTATYEILWANDDTIAIKLSCPLDRRFNHPLSIRVRVLNEWVNGDRFTVRQGNDVIGVASINESSKTSKIYIPDAIPNGETIYIERIKD